MIRRDYASGRRPGPVARPAREPRRWPRLVWGLVTGLALGALVAWLLLGRHAHGAAATAVAGPLPAIAAATPPAHLPLPPRQPSTYTFYWALTRDKASQQAAAPKQR